MVGAVSEDAAHVILDAIPACCDALLLRPRLLPVIFDLTHDSARASPRARGTSLLFFSLFSKK